MRFRNLLSALILFFVSATLTYAQTSKGIVAGTVRDSTGAVVAHADTTITSQLTGETRNTTSNGLRLIERLTGRSRSRM